MPLRHLALVDTESLWMKFHGKVVIHLRNAYYILSPNDFITTLKIKQLKFVSSSLRVG